MTQTDLIAAVIDAVATADGVDPTELDSLYEYIDPEVLAKLDEVDHGKWSFTFQYSDHQITVTLRNRYSSTASHIPQMHQ
ncbi:HalOD1 output domain-containing protein [Natrinema amylolyticum]|uniref:HalOD1 output domain-containing protein n=1 Tax=Natrinema amylolyticum TaxID=2878679 RepID=UPI001CF987D2|nr:HalOD1 output domain-containing protein [Natrinema amylolyticum]